MLQLASTLKGLQQQFRCWAKTSAQLMGDRWGGCAHFFSPMDGSFHISLWCLGRIETDGDNSFTPSIYISITDDEIKIEKKSESYTDAEAQAALDAVIKTVNKKVA